MGKFISKIAPTINSGEALKATNQKVPRKVLYRRLQSSRPYDEREFVPFTDFVRQCSGFIIMGMLMYILHKWVTHWLVGFDCHWFLSLGRFDMQNSSFIAVLIYLLFWLFLYLK